MKLVGIVGSIAEQSYNKLLMRFIASHFSGMVDIEILDITDVPMFNQSNDQSNSPTIQYLNRKILAADGVIIATPEHNHTIPAALKSVIEWLSYNLHPFADKPLMIVGASYQTQGSSRAQLNLRQILESPGVNAITMPGNEFLLGDVRNAFDDEGNLKDQKTIDFLRSTLQKFLDFVGVINKLNGRADNPGAAEDMYATGKTDTTIEGVEMTAEDWVEQASEKVHAVEGKTYVKLDRGILTVDQLNWFLNTMPMELTYADENNQFIYYNKMSEEPKSMLAPRRPGQVGDPLANVHPPRAIKGASNVVNQLRTGKTDLVKMSVPGNGPERHWMHYYKAMHDADGNYRGVNEWVIDLWPIVKYYLETTGQMLVPDPNNQIAATSGASAAGPTITTVPGPAAKAVDSASGASEAESAPAAPAAPAVDETSGASES